MFVKSDLDDVNFTICGVGTLVAVDVATGLPLFIIVNFCGLITTDVFFAKAICFELVGAIIVAFLVATDEFGVVDNNCVPVGDDFNVNTLPPSVDVVAVGPGFIWVRTV